MVIGKPMRMAAAADRYNETLNPTYREDVLDAYFFDSLEQLRILSDKWVDTYNHKHPHRSMKGLMRNQKLRLIAEGALETETLQFTNQV